MGGSDGKKRGRAADGEVILCKEEKDLTPLEKDIERALVEKVKKRGGYCLKWVCPGWTGVPDRIVLLPGGKVVFVELKRPKGGRLSPMQKGGPINLLIWVLDIGSYGTPVSFCFSRSAS